MKKNKKLSRAVAVVVTALVLITTVFAIGVSAKDTPTISGVWTWNNDYAMNNAFFRYDTGEGDIPMFYQSINFTSNNKSYTAIRWEGSAIGYDNDFVWSGDWLSDSAYATVDFGTEPQEVSEEFYTLFTKNAKKISPDSKGMGDLISAMFSGFGDTISGLADGVKDTFINIIYVDSTAENPVVSDFAIFGFMMAGLAMACGLGYFIIRKIRG